MVREGAPGPPHRPRPAGGALCRVKNAAGRLGQAGRAAPGSQRRAGRTRAAGARMCSVGSVSSPRPRREQAVTISELGKLRPGGLPAQPLGWLRGTAGPLPPLQR